MIEGYLHFKKPPYSNALNELHGIVVVVASGKQAISRISRISGASRLADGGSARQKNKNWKVLESILESRVVFYRCSLKPIQPPKLFGKYVTTVTLRSSETP